MKGKKQKLGINIIGYLRATLNKNGIPWGICEQVGMVANRAIENCEWLSTDSGMTFEKTFTPKKEAK